MNTSNRLILTALLCWAGIAGAAEPAPQVHEFQLENGMKVLVQEDHRAPVVVSQVWYKVGGSYEWSGITGVSHVLEHMMFKGTDSLEPGEFSEIIAINGGRENAFTSADYTAYFQRISADRLELCLKLEADRMRNLRILPDELAKELKVVEEERRLRTDDDPRSLTYEQFKAVAYLSSPKRNPVIGWQSDLAQLSVADVRDWYEQWYAPNNAVLVVVGDVKADEVHRLAQRYFGPHKPSAITPPRSRPEVDQSGERRIQVNAPAKLPYLLMGWKVPALINQPESWEPYALEVLSGLLDGGDSARLPSRLVRQRQIAAGASAGYDLYDRLEGLFTLSGTPTAVHSLADLEAALREEIEAIKTGHIDPAELERVKAQVVASKVYERDSSFYQAMQLGMLETVGLGWRTIEEYLPAVQAVTAEQVRAVASKYLVDERLTVAEMHPQTNLAAANGVSRQ